MQKYLLSFALFSMPAIAMHHQNKHYYEAESTNEAELPVQKPQPSIISHHFRCGANWSEIEAELSNGDTLTYTHFPQLGGASMCIHAQVIPHDPVHEYRNNASPYWQAQMKALFDSRKTAKRL